MASSRIARFFMEVAPPQYVTVMRHRTSKMLDTITEEDQSPSSSPKSSAASASASVSVSAASASSASSASSSTSACSAAIATADSKYFLKEVHRSLSILNN